MKAALFSPMRYQGPSSGTGWPIAGTTYSVEAAEKSMRSALAQFRLADEVGFDWVTVAEHHYSPFSLNPNPMLTAGALTQIVRRAKIALLGSTIPILNPIRVAEEFAMIDTMSGGRVIAGMLRGTPNEYVTYNINPAESRERFEEALALIVAAWTQTEPFGWQGRYYEYRTISIWPRPVRAQPSCCCKPMQHPRASRRFWRNISVSFVMLSMIPRPPQAASLPRRLSRRVLTRPV